MIEAHISGEKTYFPANLLRIFFDIMAADIRCSVGRLQDSRDQSEGCRFPGSVWAEQPEDFAVMRSKRDMVDSHDLSSFFVVINFGQTADFDHLFPPHRANEAVGAMARLSANSRLFETGYKIPVRLI